MKQTVNLPKSARVAMRIKSARCRTDELIGTIVEILEDEYGTETRLQERIEQLEISLETAHREYNLLKTHGSK